MENAQFSHVQLCVGDAWQAAFYYCRAFGFRVVADSGPPSGSRLLPARRAVLLEQGQIRLLLTSAFDPADPVARYFACHGDGVADIALAVPDVAATFHTMVDRGARPVAEPTVQTGPGGTLTSAVIGGFGDVVHTLVEQHAKLPTVDLAPVPEHQPVGTDDDTGAGTLLELDHFAVCLPVGDLDATVRLYEQVLGFTSIFEEFIEVGTQAMTSKVLRHDASGVTLTLLEPDRDREPGQIDTFLQHHRGAGVQHVAFRTDDIAAAIGRFSARGVDFLPTPDAYYDLVEDRVGALGSELDVLRETGILADRDAGGVLLQIFTRSPYARDTLFLELIERRGASGFGSGNIRSLYEAVQREQRRHHVG